MKKSLLAHITRPLLPLLLLCGIAAADDTPQLQKLQHVVLSPTSEQVVLQLNGSYSPKTFTLKDETPRVVFDFAQMSHGRDVKTVTPTNGAMVKRIRVGMHTDPAPKTRVVFDMTTLKGVDFSQRFDEKTSTLVVTFTQPVKAAPAKSKPTAEQGEQQAQPTAAAPPAAGKGPTTDNAQPSRPADVTRPIQADRLQAESGDTVKPSGEKPAQPVEKAEEKKTDPFAAPNQPTEDATGAPAAVTPPEATIEKKTAPAAEKAPPPAQAPAEEKIASTPPLPQPEPIVEAKTSPETAPAPTEKQAEKEEPAKETEAPKAAAEAPKEVAAKGTPASEQPAPPAVADVKAEATPTEKKNGPEAGKTEPQVKTEEGPQLHSIKFDANSPKGEMVLFKLNGFHPPVVQGVEEGVPRVICDFHNTQLADSTKKLIKADGKFVKSIRTMKTKKPEKIRVVLDLEPNKNYDLQQVFFKEDNLFVIIVNTVKK